MSNPIERLTNSVIGGDSKKAALIVSETNLYYLTAFPSTDGALLLTSEQAYYLLDFRYTEAARAKAQNVEVVEFTSLNETYKTLRALRHRMAQIFTVDDLRYLRRTGRLSNLEAAVGTVLQIKPLLKGDPQGKIVCFAKLRGRQRAVEAIAKRYEELVVDAQDQTVGIAHADCAPDAQILASLLRRSSKPPKNILMVDYEPVTGSHVGPGALALFFLADENVRNI